MIGIGISAVPISGHFLWLRWITAYDITIAPDMPRLIRLQRRQSGLTKKGNPYAWRMFGDSPGIRSTWTFTRYCRRHARGTEQFKWSLYGLNDLRGRCYKKGARPEYWHTDIITLDFGKK